MLSGHKTNKYSVDFHSSCWSIGLLQDGSLYTAYISLIQWASDAEPESQGLTLNVQLFTLVLSSLRPPGWLVGQTERQGQNERQALQSTSPDKLWLQDSLPRSPQFCSGLIERREMCFLLTWTKWCLSWALPIHNLGSFIGLLWWAHTFWVPLKNWTLVNSHSFKLICYWMKTFVQWCWNLEH